MDKVITEINKRLAKNPQVLAAYLFGSRARGTIHPDSDFDIAVLLNQNKKYSLYDEGAIVSELEGVGDAKIDTTVLNGKSPILAFEAISPQKVILSRNNNLRAEYEVSVYNSYFDDAEPYINVRHQAAVDQAHKNLKNAKN